jgi:uracil-DNA glycosylase family 4
MVCPLKDEANNLVFGKGNINADILFIGEAPGKNEDLQGLPFVGAAGKQLDRLLNNIGLGIDDVYIANILKYRPPNNRDPNAEEIKRHTPYLVRQIDAIKPKVIVTLGNFSSKFVLAGFQQAGMNKIEGITKLHGTVKEVNKENKLYKVMPMYHPAAMLYNPNLREVLDKDFRKLGEYLGIKGSNLDKWL